MKKALLKVQDPNCLSFGFLDKVAYDSDLDAVNFGRVYTPPLPVEHINTKETRSRSSGGNPRSGSS